MINEIREGFLEEGVQPNIQRQLWLGEQEVPQMERMTAAWVQGLHSGHCESGKPVEEKGWRVQGNEFAKEW